jgi:hypothetical protein
VEEARAYGRAAWIAVYPVERNLLMCSLSPPRQPRAWLPTLSLLGTQG